MYSNISKELMIIKIIYRIKFDKYQGYTNNSK